MTGTLLSLNAAVADDAHPGPAPMLVRHPVEGPRRLHALGVEGEPASPLAPSLSRAVYAYPSEHYPFWNTVRAQLGVAGWTDELSPGALGEHLTLAGVFESDVWVGDLFRFADCTLAVSEPRFPGAELNQALGFAHARTAMTAQAWCGFYLAVRVPGPIASGQAFEVVPGPREIGIAELFRARAGR